MIGKMLLVAMLLASRPLAFAKAAEGEQDLTTSRPRIIRVSAERFAFTPSEITVDKGTVIEFHLTSEDTDHGFRIVGSDVDVEIPKRRRGETIVKYTADTAGRFIIECTRPCGAGHTAMRAMLVVK
jgi:heme/copper-type cytochrome/quinol oxidase subunit 2